VAGWDRSVPGDVGLRPACTRIRAPSLMRTCVRDESGSASGRFQRACDRGQVLQAEMAAREMGRLSLIHALSLVMLYARTGSPKFELAAVRWLARLALEGREVRLSESSSLPRRSPACAAAGTSGRRRRCSACSDGSSGERR
jgi:hypothetical protein